MSANRWWTTSLSRMTVITWRRACRSPRLAKVTSFSANGRSRFAFASVVVIRPCSNSEVARLASISRSCAGDPPRRGPLVGVGMSVLPQAAGGACSAASVVVRRPGRAGGAELLTFSVAARGAAPDGGVPVLDRHGEVGDVGGLGRAGPDLDALGVDVQLAQQAEELDQRGARTGDCIARRDRRLGLDVHDEAVEVGALLDAGRLDGV